MIRNLFLLLIIISSTCFASEMVQSLQQGWEFREAGKNTKWLPAKVPGSIYTDLVQAGIIPDPLLFGNETTAKEVGNKDWEYRFSFTPSLEQWQMKHAMLNFQGLDTYVSIYLNDSLIAEHDNMFLPLQIDIRKGLKAEKNTILLRFRSALKVEAERQKLHGIKYPGGQRTFLRKAAYQHGWDWAPELPGCGIWQAVTLIWCKGLYVSDLSIVQHSLNDSLGVFKLSFRTLADQDTLMSMRISVKDGFTQNEKIQVEAGKSTHEVFLRIQNPRRWWCREFGEPYLYRLEVSFNSSNPGRQVFMRGFRTVKIDRENEGYGRGGFRILLNDKPVYIKGANYIPPSPFPGGISARAHQKSVQTAALTGINMLRVWGGGVYADSAFMSACDRAGIMVWHDFMFACAMVPFEGQMIKSIKEEIRFHASRLSAFPSLALFCGNNEISEGWFNWGWQKEMGLNPSDSSLIWRQYTLLFHIAIPGILKSVCPEIPYWESSPMTGWGRPSAYLDGDVHYWGVWWGMQAFENFKTKTGRFVSEYGFQGTPEPYLIRRMTRSKTPSFRDTDLKMHQKHPRGFETIASYAERYFPSPRDFRSQWYLSAVQQAYAMELAISAHRSKSPYNMGTMFWQWNDCWPAISWSVLDEALRPKASWYAVKREYKSLHAEFSGKFGDYSCILSLSGAESFKGTFRCEFLNHLGKPLYSKEAEVSLDAGLSKEVMRFADPLLMKKLDTALHHVSMSIIRNGELMHQSVRLLCRPRYLKMSDPAVRWKTTPAKGCYEIELHAESFAPWLSVTASLPGTFSDNYFHLEGGETRIIKFTPDVNALASPVFEVRSLYDVTDHTPSPLH